jgi:hypothetical protein
MARPPVPWRHLGPSFSGDKNFSYSNTNWTPIYGITKKARLEHMKANSPVERISSGNVVPENASVFNIVILHDDVAAGQRALGSLATLVTRFHPNTAKLRPQLWRFDLLQDADWFALALADAVNADMLVFATSSASGLPEAVENWLKLCLARKRNTDAAVVALLPAPGNPDEPESRYLQFVQGATRDAGLDFIAPELWREEALDPPQKTPRHRTTTATLGRILPRDECPRVSQIFSRICSYQHGGLNE